MRSSFRLPLLALIAAALLGPGAGPPTPTRITAARPPLTFEPNGGQAPSGVAFVARGGGLTLGLRPDGVLLRRHGADGASQGLPLRLLGADPHARAEGLQAGPGRVNVLLGRDPARWRQGLPTYGRVRFHDVYPGIDLDYYGSAGRLEHDFVVHPGADPSAIRLALPPQAHARSDGRGGLAMDWAGGCLSLSLPEAYQGAEAARRRVDARLSPGRPNASLAVGPYDRARDLVVDPVLAWSTYVGTPSDDMDLECAGMAVDPAGHVFLTSFFDGSFPSSAGAFQPAPHGAGDVLIIRLAPDGSSLDWATYLGGSGMDEPYSLAADASGRIAVAGQTDSPDFPVSAGAFQSAQNGAASAFVAQLDASGATLVASTLLGGTNQDGALGVALDPAGAFYLALFLSSANFPFTPGAYCLALGASGGGVAKVSSDAKALIWASALPGTDLSGIAVDGLGEPVVVGDSIIGVPFPTTTGAWQGGSLAIGAGICTRFKADGSGLVYSARLGGNGDSEADAVCLDAASHAVVAGRTGSTDLPAGPGAYQTALSGSGAYVARLDALGAVSVLSYLCPSDPTGFIEPISVACNGAGTVFLGVRSGDGLPVTADALQLTAAPGQTHAGMLIFDAPLAHLIYGTYWAGSATEDDGPFVGLDGSGFLYTGGSTYSTDFPTTAGAYLGTWNPPLATEALVAAKWAPPTPTPSVTATGTATRSPTATPSATITLTATITCSRTPTPTITQTCTASPTATPVPPPLYLQPFPPNPNPIAQGPIYLPYRVPVNAQVTIKAYDVSGELVRALDPHPAPAGVNEQSWDLRNSAGQPVASGVYLLRFTATDDGGEKVQAWTKCAVVR